MSTGERNQPEVASRTLFVRGLATEVSTDMLKQLFGPYGDLRDVYNLAERKGIAFIEFVRAPYRLCARGAQGPAGLTLSVRCDRPRTLRGIIAACSTTCERLKQPA